MFFLSLKLFALIVFIFCLYVLSVSFVVHKNTHKEMGPILERFGFDMFEIHLKSCNWVRNERPFEYVLHFLSSMCMDGSID